MQKLILNLNTVSTMEIEDVKCLRWVRENKTANYFIVTLLRVSLLLRVTSFQIISFAEEIKRKERNKHFDFFFIPPS